MNFNNLIEKHLDSLLFAALRLTKNREDAEDIVQETCFKAYKKRGTLRFKGKAKAWLFRILTNTFINNYRKEQSSAEIVDGDLNFLESIFYTNGQYVDLEKEIFSKVMDEEIKSTIDNLPIDFRLVIVLVDIEGLSYREVEDILKISPGTLASRLYRGRRLLRDALYEHAKKRGHIKGKRNEL